MTPHASRLVLAAIALLVWAWYSSFLAHPAPPSATPAEPAATPEGDLS